MILIKLSKNLGSGSLPAQLTTFEQMYVLRILSVNIKIFIIKAIYISFPHPRPVSNINTKGIDRQFFRMIDSNNIWEYEDSNNIWEYEGRQNNVSIHSKYLICI